MEPGSLKLIKKIGIFFLIIISAIAIKGLIAFLVGWRTPQPNAIGFLALLFAGFFVPLATGGLCLLAFRGFGKWAWLLAGISTIFTFFPPLQFPLNYTTGLSIRARTFDLNKLSSEVEAMHAASDESQKGFYSDKIRNTIRGFSPASAGGPTISFDSEIEEPQFMCSIRWQGPLNGYGILVSNIENPSKYLHVGAQQAVPGIWVFTDHTPGR